jgi:uroporphyrinogen-III synthase
VADDCRLDGIGVLVTRPAHQAEALCALIEARGGRAVRFPTLEIRDPRDPAAAEALLRAADTFDVLLFVSANAVERAAAHLRTPPRAAIGAVGEATARALRSHGLEPSILPAGQWDSEGLLAAPALGDVRGRRVLIVRGEGGRPLLGEQLAVRGAEVRYAEVYRRAPTALDAEPLVARWRDEVQVVVATSREVLDNLVARLGAAGLKRLRETPLVVVSERLAGHARALGIRRVLVADAASDAALVQAACAAVRAA